MSEKMCEPQLLATLTASTACTGIALSYLYHTIPEPLRNYYHIQLSSLNFTTGSFLALFLINSINLFLSALGLKQRLSELVQCPNLVIFTATGAIDTLRQMMSAFLIYVAISN
jgi:hypothetical protein